jgi:hypothetical protein
LFRRKAGLAGYLAAAFLTLAWAPNALAEENVVHCALSRSGSGFTGHCLVPCLVNNLSIDIAGPKPGAVCHAPPRQVDATLHPTDKAGHWLGAMQGKFPEDPTRFDLILGKDGASGVAKTPFGWFALRSEQISGDTMTLVIAANSQLPPTRDDILIIERAIAMLPNDAAWNRHDTRVCTPNPQKRSLFCALKDATIETTGGLQYRQPALQAVRQEVAKVFDGHVKKHRLMEYNNSSTTTLAGIHNVLLAAEVDIKKNQLQ